MPRLAHGCAYLFKLYQRFPSACQAGLYLCHPAQSSKPNVSSREVCAEGMEGVSKMGAGMDKGVRMGAKQLGRSRAGMDQGHTGHPANLMAWAAAPMEDPPMARHNPLQANSETSE